MGLQRMRSGLLPLAALSALMLGACGDSDSGSGGSNGASAGEKLATLQTNGPPDEALVRQFDAQVEALTAKCNERPITLADFTVRTQGLLAKDGVSEPLLSIISHVNRSIPASPNLTPTRCRDLFAAYVTLRTAG